MKILYATLMVLVLSSCASHQETIESDSREIIECIRENDFNRFKKFVDERALSKDEFRIHFYFEEGHKLMRKSDQKRFSYKISKMDDLYFTRVMILVSSEFDSLIGAKKTYLQLSFRPSTQYSKYSKLQWLDFEYEYDEAYRNKLRGM